MGKEIYVGTAVLASVAAGETGSATVILGHAPTARLGSMPRVRVVQVEACSDSEEYYVMIFDRAAGLKDTIHQGVRYQFNKAYSEAAQAGAWHIFLNDATIHANPAGGADDTDIAVGDGNDRMYAAVTNAAGQVTTGQIEVRVHYQEVD